MVSVVVAILGLVGAILGSYITVRSQVARVQKDNHLLYLWNRELVDHIYRGKPPPPPAPPKGLFE